VTKNIDHQQMFAICVDVRMIKLLYVIVFVTLSLNRAIVQDLKWWKVMTQHVHV